MSVRTVVVAHRETLAAEGIAAALARYPALAPIGVATSAAETERCAEQAEAVAIDARIPGAQGAVGRMRKRGLRVVVIGDRVLGEDDEGSVVVAAVDAPVAHLASALAPGARPRTSRGADLSPGRAGHPPRCERDGLQADRSRPRDQPEDRGATQDASVQAPRRAEPGGRGGDVRPRRGPGVEPIHYLRALRRRWWVIAAVGARRERGRVVHDRVGYPRPAAAASSEPTAYTATTVLWNPGAPTIGVGSPITSMDALAQVVRLPGRRRHRREEDGFQGTARAQLTGAGVGGSGERFPEHHGDGAEAADGRGRFGRLSPRRCSTYLEQLNDHADRPAAEAGPGADQRPSRRRASDPSVIASLRAGLSQLGSNRTAPVALTTFQHATRRSGRARRLPRRQQRGFHGAEEPRRRGCCSARCSGSWRGSSSRWSWNDSTPGSVPAGPRRRRSGSRCLRRYRRSSADAGRRS